MEENTDDDLGHALQPQVLFPSNMVSELLTLDTLSDVFDDPDIQTPSGSSKLSRNNAFRRRQSRRQPRTAASTPSTTSSATGSSRITRSQTRNSQVGSL